MLLTDHKRQENNSSVTLNETILSIEFYDLLPYYAYDVAVTAFNRKGISPASTFNALTGERGRGITMERSRRKLHFTVRNCPHLFNVQHKVET